MRLDPHAAAAPGAPLGALEPEPPRQVVRVEPRAPLRVDEREAVVERRGLPAVLLEQLDAHALVGAVLAQNVARAVRRAVVDGHEPPVGDGLREYRVERRPKVRTG